MNWLNIFHALGKKLDEDDEIDPELEDEIVEKVEEWQELRRTQENDEEE